MGRPAGWRMVKSHMPYSIDEVARNQGVSKGTVGRWLDNGLPAIKDRKPYIIKGGDLIDFLQARKPPKQTCKPDECYCLKCRAPRKAAFAEIEYQPTDEQRGQMIALCEECTTVMFRCASLAQIEALKGTLHVTIRQDSNHIGNGTEASLNDSKIRN